MSRFANDRTQFEETACIRTCLFLDGFVHVIVCNNDMHNLEMNAFNGVIFQPLGVVDSLHQYSIFVGEFVFSQILRKNTFEIKQKLPTMISMSFKSIMNVYRGDYDLDCNECVQLTF